MKRTKKQTESTDLPISEYEALDNANLLSLTANDGNKRIQILAHPSLWKVTTNAKAELQGNLNL